MVTRNDIVNATDEQLVRLCRRITKMPGREIFPIRWGFFPLPSMTQEEVRRASDAQRKPFLDREFGGGMVSAISLWGKAMRLEWGEECDSGVEPWTCITAGGPDDADGVTVIDVAINRGHRQEAYPVEAALRFQEPGADTFAIAKAMMRGVVWWALETGRLSA